MKKAWAPLALTLVASAASAQTPPSDKAPESLFSAGWPWSADAKVLDDQGRTYTIYVHRKHDVLLIQPRMSEIIGGAGAVSHWPINSWRHAAETFVAPLGCGIPDVYAVTKAGATWEATFVCPTGVDLRATVIAQRAALQQGQPLHP